LLHATSNTHQYLRELSLDHLTGRAAAEPDVTPDYKDWPPGLAALGRPDFLRVGGGLLVRAGVAVGFGVAVRVVAVPLG
jgi:hypothetical protein